MTPSDAVIIGSHAKSGSDGQREDSDLLLPQADHFTLCRCGGSKKKPFCDGSHLENDFKG